MPKGSFFFEPLRVWQVKFVPDLANQFAGRFGIVNLTVAEVFEIFIQGIQVLFIVTQQQVKLIPVARKIDPGLALLRTDQQCLFKLSAVAFDNLSLAVFQFELTENAVF